MGISSQINMLTTSDERFKLLKRFSMPVDPGHSLDAISVTTEASKILLSLYSLMLSMIILQIWALVVLVGIAISTRHHRVTHNMGVANVIIWNSQSSPLAVIKAMFDYRSHIPMYALRWVCLALVAWAGAISFSSFVSPILVIGDAAPVNPNKVFVPEIPSDAASSFYLQTLALQVPSNLRAIDILETVDNTTGKPENTFNGNLYITSNQDYTTTDGLPITEVDYTYNVTGVDFGLQHLPKLLHQVQGSCYTEYGWIDQSIVNDYEFADNYTLFPDINGSRVARVSSSLDGKPPLTTVYVPDATPDINDPLRTFAFTISSLYRLSYTPSTDPWYATVPTSADTPTQGAKNQVNASRPVLVCTQSDFWILGNQNVSIGHLDEIKAIPSPLVDTFQRFLSQPRIIELTQALGTSALKSAQTSQGIFFDAGSATVQADITRLILGAYIATKALLTETTQYDSANFPDIHNLVQDNNGKVRAGTGDFVVYGSGFAALSIRVLIVVPVILALLFLLVFVLSGDWPISWPWGYVNALRAAVLYSTIDTSNFKPDGDQEKAGWARGTSPYVENDGEAHVRPRYDRDSRSFSWGRQQPEGRVNGEEAAPDEDSRGRGSLPTIDARLTEPNASEEVPKETV